MTLDRDLPVRPRVRIAYTLVPGPLGYVLLAATDRGVCALLIGQNVRELERSLATRYPEAAINHSDEELASWRLELQEHLDGRRPELRWPLDLQGTAFQKRVWQELVRIPYGSTRTYAEVARAVGQPTAVRAVGRACGANPVAIAVPCHRVLRSDGSLGGYSGGLGYKEKLLALERQPGLAIA